MSGWRPEPQPPYAANDRSVAPTEGRIPSPRPGRPRAGRGRRRAPRCRTETRPTAHGSLPAEPIVGQREREHCREDDKGVDRARVAAGAQGGLGVETESRSRLTGTVSCSHGSHPGNPGGGRRCTARGRRCEPRRAGPERCAIARVVDWIARVVDRIARVVVAPTHPPRAHATSGSGYSARSATTASSRLARQAGSRHAAMATAASTVAVTAYVAGSCGPIS